jgi:hypothetical protein
MQQNGSVIVDARTLPAEHHGYHYAVLPTVARTLQACFVSHSILTINSAYRSVIGVGVSGDACTV